MADQTTNTGTPATTPSTVSPSHSIRNISQTVQEREIIKSAPDIIVYLDGKSYLINPYIVATTVSDKTATPTGTYVSFNDHVQSFQSSYDLDTLIPSGSLTLQVPNHMKHLYQSPGGNNLIESMMEIQVYAKGWFPSGTGNTVYHRVFKGLTTNVSHVDNGAVLQINLQVQGILHFLDFMFLDLSPALLSNSESGVTPLISLQAKMNPYEMLASVFNESISMAGFLRSSINQIDDKDWHSAIEAGFLNKWQPILDNIRREVHITGWRMGKDTVLPVPDTADDGATQKGQDAQGTQDPTLLASRFTITPKVATNANNPDAFVDVLRKYQMDFGVGSIQLINGRITSQLERIRTVVQVIGFEGFQDIDGTIIFKPPLYNLDVTNVGEPIKSSTGGAIPTSVDIRSDTNPFIVHLSEIESESEVEDEQGIRATRMSVSTVFTPNAMVPNDPTSQLRPTVTHIDIPRLSKFGLREEPARPIPWLTWNDKIAAYTYAVCELNRANRSFRTYTLTIPLRPELKLGFPMYLPHKDIYGYIKNVSINYQQGGAATMSIVLDALRKRPMFPATHTVTQNGQQKKVQILTTQPNLVMKWTNPPEDKSKSTTATATGTTNNGAATATASGSTAPSNKSNKMDAPATQRQPTAKPVYADDLEVVDNRKQKYGSSWETKSDTKSKSFRVQNDVATAEDGVPVGQPFFSAKNWLSTDLATPASSSTPPPVVNGQQQTTPPSTKKGINVTYMQKVLTCQPYTDEGGYELLTPFPWGRWLTLKEALLETRLGMVSPNPVDSLNAETISGTDVFLFAGVGSPQDIDPSNSLATELTKLDKLNSLTGTNNDLSKYAPSSTTFELITPTPGVPQNKSLTDTQPDSQLLSGVDSTTARTDFFVTGSDAPCLDYQKLYRTITPPTNTNEIPTAIGVTPSANSQSQTFVSKLLNGETTKT